MRAPASGCDAAWRSRSAMRPGISCSASSISLRPKSASERSATLKSEKPAAADGVGGGCHLDLLREGTSGAHAAHVFDWHDASRPGSPDDSLGPDSATQSSATPGISGASGAAVCEAAAMDLELRPITEAERERFRPATGDRVREHRAATTSSPSGAPSSTVDAHRWPASTATRSSPPPARYSFELTVPGGARVPTGRRHHRGRPPDAPTPRTAHADDGRAARRRRQPRSSRSRRSPRRRRRSTDASGTATRRRAPGGSSATEGTAFAWPSAADGHVPTRRSRHRARGRSRASTTRRRKRTGRRGDPQRVVLAHVYKDGATGVARRRRHAVLHRGARRRRRARRRASPATR